METIILPTMEDSISYSVNSSQIDVRSNITLQKILTGCFLEIDKLILNFTWKYKRPRIEIIILK